MTPMVSATIDTAALKHNLQRVRDFAPRSRVMAVIKANAYGHGLVAVARALDQADAFAVARVDEGLTLRMAGFRSARCCSRACSTAGSSIRPRPRDSSWWCTPREQIELLRQAGAGEPFRVWLKLDTGMNRLGFKGAAFGTALDTLRALPRVQSPVNLFTHLASADDPDSPATVEQIARFARGDLGAHGRAQHRQLRRHAGLFASAGRLGAPGLLLYGVSPFSGRSVRTTD